MRAIWGPLSTVTTVRADSAPSLSNTAQSRKNPPILAYDTVWQRTLPHRRFWPKRVWVLWIVAQSNDPPRNIGELIDQIEHIREELFSIQRSMEKLETLKAAPPPDQAEKR